MEKAVWARTSNFSATSFYQLHRLVSRLTKAAEAKLRETGGMSFSQFLVLSALCEKDNLSQVEIADYVGVTPAVVTKQVDYLCSAGWTVRTASPHDRRTHAIRLSAGGRRLVEQARKLLQQAYVKELAAMAPSHYGAKLSETVRQFSDS